MEKDTQAMKTNRTGTPSVRDPLSPVLFVSTTCVSFSISLTPSQREESKVPSELSPGDWIKVTSSKQIRKPKVSAGVLM